MQLNPKPDWLNDAALQQFFAAVKRAGGEARAVGGCVRDFLLGKTGGDVDLATTLAPDEVMALAKAEGFKPVPTGIAHGTVTVVMPARVVEVTTLRRDVETYGRHAKVEYTSRFEEDAARRDFTINAMYMDAEGGITDYFEGQLDLKSRRLRFIGDAHQRIEEDGLRILRYFRFLAQLGWKAEAEARAACAAHKAMIDELSGERIQQEMKKLFATAGPAYAAEQMDKIDLPEHITGDRWELGALKFLLQQEAQHTISPWLRLAVMLPEKGRTDAASHISQRWKLSREDQKLLQYLCAPHEAPQAAAIKEWLRANPRDWVIWRILFNAARTRHTFTEELKLAASWHVPTFPVGAKDLKLPEGPEIGNQLRELERRWVESDYTLDKKALLSLKA